MRHKVTQLGGVQPVKACEFVLYVMLCGESLKALKGGSDIVSNVLEKN